MAAGGVFSAEDVKALLVKKDEMEAEIKELYSVLESQKDVGMDGPLIDEEQYPRNDIDVYTVRHARHRIICLQNDHKAIMSQIEDSLHQLHAHIRAEKSSAAEHMDTQSTEVTRQPFAEVNRVDLHSPAAQGGLQVNDLLVEFGSVSIDNFKSLKDIGQVVQHSKGKPVNITVLRKKGFLHMAVTPNPWAGNGLLGCNIVPLKS